LFINLLVHCLRCPFQSPSSQTESNRKRKWERSDHQRPEGDAYTLANHHRSAIYHPFHYLRWRFVLGSASFPLEFSCRATPLILLHSAVRALKFIQRTPRDETRATRPESRFSASCLPLCGTFPEFPPTPTSSRGDRWIFPRPKPPTTHQKPKSPTLFSY
jgi:hypothetical protein